MARQVYVFAVTVATGTTAAAPQKAPLTVPTLAVESVRFRIPPGPAGQVGFQLSVGDQQIIPYQAGTWLVADNEVINYDLTGFPDSGAWGLIAYNIGFYPHTIEAAFAMAPPAVTPPPVIQPLLLQAPQ